MVTVTETDVIINILCSGSPNTFCRAIPSILTIKCYESPTKGGPFCSHFFFHLFYFFLLFLRGRAGVEVGYRHESWGSGPWMRYQLHRASVQGRCRQTTVRRSSLLGILAYDPSLASSSSRQQRGDLYVSITSFHSKRIATRPMTSLFLLLMI